MNTPLAKKSAVLFGIIVLSAVICALCFPRVAYADPDQAYIVDSGGGGDFTTIQDAVDAVQNATVTSSTKFTITVNAGTYDEEIQVIQQEFKNVVIQAAPGAAVTVEGRIMIDGMGRHDGTETLAIEGLTIIDQDPGDSDAACILTDNIGGEAHYSYVHNLTVANCVFDSNAAAGSTPNTTGIRIQSGEEGEAYNVTVEDCSASENMHSLLQGQGGTENIEISGCEVTGIKGINLIPSGTCVINDCTFDAVEYAVRLGSGSAGTALADCALSITNCTLTVDEADPTAGTGVIVTRGDAPDSYAISDSTLLNTAAGGVVWNNLNPSQSDAMAFSLTGNYWGPEGCNDASFAGMDAAALAAIFSAGNTYIIYLSYDANGGSFPDGSTVQPDRLGTVTVITDTATQTRSSMLIPVLPDKPSFVDYVFQGWFTAATGGAEVTADGSGAGNTFVAKDSTLYAQWSVDLTPSLNVAVNPLHLATDVVLTQKQFLEAVGAQAFDGLGGELPLSSIVISDWDALQFGKANWVSGNPYVVTLSITDHDLTTSVEVEVFVMPENTALTAVADYGAAGLPAAPDGFEWAETSDGIYVLRVYEQPEPPEPPAPAPDQPSAKGGSPKTGDAALLELFGGLAVAFFSICATLLAYRRIRGHW